MWSLTRSSRIYFWAGAIYQGFLWATLVIVGFFAWNGSTISHFSKGQQYIKQMMGKNVPYRQVNHFK
jgi:hypothetical protein